MKKSQKIWLAISLSMFLLPELLWSSIGNFYYEFFQSGDVHPFRNNFLTNSENFGTLKFIFFVQFVGAILFLLLVLFKKINKLMKVFLLFFSLLLILIIGFVVLFAFYNNPRIG